MAAKVYHISYQCSLDVYASCSTRSCWKTVLINEPQCSIQTNILLRSLHAFQKGNLPAIFLTIFLTPSHHCSSWKRFLDCLKTGCQQPEFHSWNGLKEG